DRRQAKAEAGGARSGGGELELPEPLLEAVEVAAREIGGLLDYPVALDASGERAELAVEPLDFLRRQVSELLEPGEAQRLERGREFGADSLDLAQIVARSGFAVELAADGRAQQFAGQVAGRGDGFAGQPAALRQAASRHGRP